MSVIERIRATVKPPVPGEVCHLGRDCAAVTAACGVSVTPGRHPSPVKFHGQSACPVHGSPICSTCKAIVQAFERSGGWEGV
jgi:hypothetical protein